MCGTERNRPRLSGRPDEPPYVSTVWEFWAKSVTVVTSPRKCQCSHTSCPLRAWRQERWNESFLSLSVLVPRLCFIPFQTWQSNMSGSCSKQHPVSFYLRQNPHAQDFCNRQHKIIKTLACCEVKHHTDSEILVALTTPAQLSGGSPHDTALFRADGVHHFSLLLPLDA